MAEQLAHIVGAKRTTTRRWLACQSMTQLIDKISVSTDATGRGQAYNQGTAAIPAPGFAHVPRCRGAAALRLHPWHVFGSAVCTCGLRCLLAKASDACGDVDPPCRAERWIGCPGVHLWHPVKGEPRHSPKDKQVA
jgi:hypothetical protein